jgi:hypothetical protein
MEATRASLRVITMKSACLENNLIPAELAELYCRIEALRCRSRGELLALCDQLADWSYGMQRLVNAAQEAVDQLQLDVAYLRFDRDCTRRERDAFREQLEQG